VLITVPAVLRTLVNSRQAPRRLPRLKAIRTSAADLPLDLKQAAELRYAVPVVQLYGSTESGFAFATTQAHTPEGSIGQPLPGVSVQLVDESARQVGQGETGELVLRAPGMMLGYLGDPSATAEVLRDGWLWTGDLARQTADGFYTLVGRRDGRITSKGFKVLPEEVETVLASHPGVKEVAVTSDRDPIRGHAVRAVIVAADKPPSAAELARFCRQRLAEYKVPRRFEFVDELPRTALGKVKRSSLQGEHGV